MLLLHWQIFLANLLSKTLHSFASGKRVPNSELLQRNSDHASDTDPLLIDGDTSNPSQFASAHSVLDTKANGGNRQGHVALKDTHARTHAHTSSSGAATPRCMTSPSSSQHVRLHASPVDGYPIAPRARPHSLAQSIPRCSACAGRLHRANSCASRRGQSPL